MEREVNLDGLNSKNVTVYSFLYAVILLMIGYLYFTVVYKVLYEESAAFLFFLSTTALFATTLAFGFIRGGKISIHCVVALMLGLSASAHPWFNGGFFVTSYLSFRLLMVSYTFFVLALFNNHNRKLSIVLLFLDIVKANLIYPFLAFSSFFTSLLPIKRENREVGKAILFTLIGIIAAAILGTISILLLSYEPSFAKIFRLEWNWEKVPSVIIRLFFCVPLAALLFSVFTSSIQHRLPQISTPEMEKRFETGIKKIPAVVFLIPVAVLIVIYTCFFFTQIETYTSAFSGILPDAYKAAEYARNGFFELCSVSAINTLFSILMNYFMKDTKRGTIICKKIANTLLAVATLVLIATALSKMVLYIRRFDLTVMRLIVSVVLILIAIGFIFSILAQWIKCIKVSPVLIVCVMALLLAVPFLNVRGQIAKYNVDAYLKRNEQGIEVMEIDVYYLMYELGTAATPDAIRLLKSGTLSAESYKELENYLKEEHIRLNRKDGVFEMTLSDLRARNALEDAKL